MDGRKVEIARRLFSALMMSNGVGLPGARLLRGRDRCILSVRRGPLLLMGVTELSGIFVLDPHDVPLVYTGGATVAVATDKGTHEPAGNVYDVTGRRGPWLLYLEQQLPLMLDELRLNWDESRSGAFPGAKTTKDVDEDNLNAARRAIATFRQQHPF